MKLVSTLVVAASVAAACAFAAPALAQDKAQAGAPTKQPERKYSISKEAQKPIADLQAAVIAKQNDNFAQLLAAAEAVAKNADEKYLVARFRLEHAKNINDPAATTAAVQAVLASGGADPSETAQLNDYLAAVAAQSDPAAAETLFTRRLAAAPDNIDLITSLARAKLELKKDAEALALLQRAISLSKANGKLAPEAWYRKVMEIAHTQNNRPLALQSSREVLNLFPTPENLRNAIVIYEAGAKLDKEANLDLLRLMRATRILQPAGYDELAFLLNDAGLPGEAKSTIEEGRRLGVLQGSTGAALLAAASARIADDRASLAGVDARARSAADGTLALRTANAYLGYGDYAKAADLYRVALAKGGVDANLAHTRIGIALALAGQKAEASAAFQAVSGPRADLAALWQAWLNQRG